jgi:asparagine synthase (glutamine-hydrolysing)
LSPLGAYLYGEFHATKLPAILRMFDRASMAHGVEIRNAFLDWRIVRYAFSLRDESKIGGGFSKRISSRASALERPGIGSTARQSGHS